MGAIRPGRGSLSGATVAAPLGYYELAGTAASFDFQNISQAYRNLRIVVVARGDDAGANQALRIRFNNDSGANYDDEVEYATGATVGGLTAAAATSGRICYISCDGAAASRVGIADIVIPNYVGTTFFKTAHGRGGQGSDTAGGTPQLDTGLVTWRSAAAITRVTLFPGAGLFKAGSFAMLVGEVAGAPLA